MKVYYNQQWKIVLIINKHNKYYSHSLDNNEVEKSLLETRKYFLQFQQLN